MCHICDLKIAIKNSSTTNLIAHLKGHHGFFKKYNAWKEYGELSSLKDERLKNLKRKNCLSLSTVFVYCIFVKAAIFFHGYVTTMLCILADTDPLFGPQFIKRVFYHVACRHLRISL